MKKDVNANRYEDELVILIEDLKEVVKDRRIDIAERTIKEISELLKLLKHAMENKLTPPK